MQNNHHNSLRIALWGTPAIAARAFEILYRRGIVPEIVICAPDKPRGRKLVITPPETKVWAEEHGIAVLQPEKLSDPEFLSEIRKAPWDLFVVFAYGKIIPKSILTLPQYGALNIHPSLLPRLRGASPIQSAILEEAETGVTIMQMDEEMDHGPIVAQDKVVFDEWPPRASELEEILSTVGAELLADILEDYLNGLIKLAPQDHSKATFTKKITKEDGLVDLADDPEKNLRKIRAFDMWPRAYFFAEKNGAKTRVVITDAKLKDGKLVILKVIPEGKSEVDFESFKQAYS